MAAVSFSSSAWTREETPLNISPMPLMTVENDCVTACPASLSNHLANLSFAFSIPFFVTPILSMAYFLRRASFAFSKASSMRSFSAALSPAAFTSAWYTCSKAAISLSYLVKRSSAFMPKYSSLSCCFTCCWRWIIFCWLANTLFWYSFSAAKRSLVPSL